MSRSHSPHRTSAFVFSLVLVIDGFWTGLDNTLSPALSNTSCSALSNTSCPSLSNTSRPAPITFPSVTNKTLLAPHDRDTVTSAGNRAPGCHIQSCTVLYCTVLYCTFSLTNTFTIPYKHLYSHLQTVLLSLSYSAFM